MSVRGIVRAAPREIDTPRIPSCQPTSSVPATFSPSGSIPWLSRLLMLPLLFGAGYLFRILLSIGDVIGGVKESELLAGQIICLVLGLLVGVPGLMGFLIRNSLVIDKAQGRVTKFHDFRLFSVPRSFDLSHVSLITITWEEPSGRTRPAPIATSSTSTWFARRIISDHVAFFERSRNDRSRNELSVALEYRSGSLGHRTGRGLRPGGAGYGYAVKSAPRAASQGSPRQRTSRNDLPPVSPDQLQRALDQFGRDAAAAKRTRCLGMGNDDGCGVRR